jgi:hypothetical protein
LETNLGLIRREEPDPLDSGRYVMARNALPRFGHESLQLFAAVDEVREIVEWAGRVKDSSKRFCDCGCISL